MLTKEHRDLAVRRFQSRRSREVLKHVKPFWDLVLFCGLLLPCATFLVNYEKRFSRGRSTNPNRKIRGDTGVLDRSRPRRRSSAGKSPSRKCAGRIGD